jgi:hypothetical protein
LAQTRLNKTPTRVNKLIHYLPVVIKEITLT